MAVLSVDDTYLGAFTADAEGKLLAVSPCLSQMLGYSAQNMQGQEWLSFVAIADHSKVKIGWAASLQARQPFCDQFRLKQASGEFLWVAGQLMPTWTDDGSLQAIQGICLPLLPPVSISPQVEWKQKVSAVAHSIGRSLNLRQVVYSAVAEIQQLFQVERALIFRLEPTWRGTVMSEAVSPGWLSILDRVIADPCFAMANASLYQEGKPRATDDIYAAPHLSQCYVDLLAGFEVRAILSAPILQERQLWGLLILHQCSAPRQWQPWEVEAAQQLAAHLGVAIYQCEQLLQLQRANADLERQVQKSNAQLKLAIEFEATLKRIADRVRDSLDENQILQTAVRELAIAAGVSNCNASLYDLERRTSTVCYEYTTFLEPVQGRTVMMDNFPEGYSQLLQGQYFQFCSLLPNPKRGRVAMLACPIVDDQGALGDLWLISQEYRAFNDQDIRLVQQVANQCAIAIRQARLYQAAQAQVKELEKLNRLKDDFLSTVSHELRTPISNIKMATQMLELALSRLELLEANEANPVSRYFRILNDECQRESRLINDLLDLSRLEVVEEVLTLTDIDLSVWLPHLVAPFVERARGHQQALELDLMPNLPLLTTDLSRLERILNELLNNACKYTPANETIRVVAKSDGHQVCLSITNSGIEIPPQELAHIFDKFYRIPNNDPWKHGGTGLGLALVKRLVETLGGGIDAVSSRNQTSFILKLPLAIAVLPAITQTNPEAAIES